MFSVIIPLHNKSAYIERCLQSVWDQTLKDFEVIIVNDGSTDDGFEKVKKSCAKYSGIRTKGSDFIEHGLMNADFTYINQSNSGVSTARNNGVKAAKYNYITFLDADDWWDVHFLEEMKGLIKEFPDAGLYGCNYFYVKNGKTRIDNKGLPDGFKSGYINYFKVYGKTFSVPFNCSFVVVPQRTFIHAGGFNPDLKYGEDFDLWVRIALHNQVAYLNKSLSYSNQDAERSNRAVGNSHLFTPDNHYVFNMDYLSEDEQINPELKFLLNGLRVRSLIHYHIFNRFEEQVKKELAKVNLHEQPFFFRFIYKSPKLFVRVFFILRKFGSDVKQFMITKF